MSDRCTALSRLLLAAQISASVICVILLLSPRAFCQTGSVASSSFRPFVVSWTPVIGRNGAVGGVSIDTAGVVSRADPTEAAKLAHVWQQASQPQSASLIQRSRTRKVSLSRLERVLNELLDQSASIPDEMLFLAGLQRVEYLLVYPQTREIVIAGPAEGWHLDQRGSFVGHTTKQPVLRLDDLIEAFRSASASADGMSCSIDASDEGLDRLQNLLKSRSLQFSPQTVELMQRAVGPHQVRVSGVSPDSHFAQVMVAADYIMKRLAMGLEPSPVEGLRSYMDTLQSQSARTTRPASPRWWLAVDYRPLSKSADELAWRLTGQRVRALTEDGFLSASGGIINTGRSSPLAEDWAQAMTTHYAALAEEVPVFAELRNCVDLAVLAAVIIRHDLSSRAGCPPPFSTGSAGKTRGPRYPVPRFVESQASLVQARRGWFVSISGGVDLDPWEALRDIASEEALGELRLRLPPKDAGAWWWD